MNKNKKAISLPFEFIIFVLLGILILVIVVFLWPSYGKPLWGQFMGLNSLNTTSDSSLGVTPFQVFANEFKQCSILPESNCLCPLSPFSLPETGLIQLQETSNYLGIKESDKDLLLINYNKGSISESLLSSNYGGITLKLGEITNGCSITSKGSVPEKYCINNANNFLKNVNIFFPSKTPGSFSEYATNNVFDTSSYFKTDELFLARPKNNNAFSAVKIFYKPGAYNQGIYFTEKAFYLLTIYKENNNLYFVPVSDSLLPTSADKTNIESLKKQIKTCEIPKDFDKATSLFSNLNKAIQDCKLTNGILGKDSLCQKFNVNLPKDYSIEIGPYIQKTLYLNYKDSKIDNFNFNQDIRVSYNGQFEGFSSLTLNVNPSKQKNLISSNEEKIVLPAVKTENTVYLGKTIAKLGEMVVTNPDIIEIYKCANGDICLKFASSLSEGQSEISEKAIANEIVTI